MIFFGTRLTRAGFATQVCDFTVRNGTPSEQQKYNEDSAAQVQELLTRYKPQELWFDAGYQPSINPDVARVVRQSAQGIPCHSCHVNDTDSGIRWMGNEDAQQPLPNWGATDDCEITGAAGAPHFCPTSCDTVLRQHCTPPRAPLLRYPGAVGGA